VFVVTCVDQNSVVVIATRYGLEGPGIESGGDIFLIRLVQPWDQPSPLYNAYRASFREVKQLGLGFDQPLPSSAEVKGRAQPYI
jgi:hypothetical protein